MNWFSNKKPIWSAIVALAIAAISLVAYSQSENNIYLPLICAEGCSSNIQQLEKINLLNSINLITNTLPIPKDYEPFQVGDDNNIDLRGDWALFNLMSVPIEEKQEEYGSSPNILLGVAHKENEEWEVYIESTPRYLSILDSLPEWLQWLAERNSLVNATSNSSTVSVPGLPFSPGHSWRYTHGPNSGHKPFESIDFATWPRNIPSMVHAVDSGRVVAVGNNHSSNNCITVENQNGIKIFIFI